MKTKIRYSAIIPVFNEEKSLKELTRRLIKVFDDLQKSYELIFIDDGSKDNSFSILEKLSRKNSKIKIISFRKNFGKSTALACGFHFSRGEIIFTLDADLQDQPEDIPLFLKKLKEGYDLVSGWKKKRNDPIDKVIISRIFNFLTARFTGVKIHDFNCGFKVYKREVINNLEVYGDLYRFIPALAFWQGFKVGEVEVHHQRRLYGKSKFGQSRLPRGFFDLFTVVFILRFLKRPLHFFGFLGLIFFFFGLIINLYLTFIWFKGQAIGHRPLLILGMLLIVVGIQFISTGLLGEMMTYFQSKSEKEKIYPIDKTLGDF
jgi:glycosyltransferase involved in cell wall biosynthesis